MKNKFLLVFIFLIGCKDVPQSCIAEATMYGVICDDETSLYDLRREACSLRKLAREHSKLLYSSGKSEYDMKSICDNRFEVAKKYINQSKFISNFR